jgi:hypothetical protein
MNYFAQGIDNGARIGADAFNRQLQKQLELDMLAKRQAAEKQLQDDRITAEAKRQFSQQGWQSGEADKNRAYGTSERIGTQTFHADESNKGRGFQAGESKLDRDLRQALQKQQLDQAASQFAQEMTFKGKVHDDDMPLKGAQLGLMARAADTRDAAQAWREDADNPYNTIRDAQAKKLASDMGAFPPVGGQFTAKEPGTRALTPTDANALAWAKANPNDPRAAAILQRLGVK